MGLDFYIERRRKGEAYSSSAYEIVVCGRNCYNVRDLVLTHISTYNAETQTAPLTIGTMNELVVWLSNDLRSYNLNDKETFEDASYWKLLNWIAQLSNCIADAIIDYADGIEYEYVLVNSY